MLWPWLNSDCDNVDYQTQTWSETSLFQLVFYPPLPPAPKTVNGNGQNAKLETSKASLKTNA